VSCWENKYYFFLKYGPTKKPNTSKLISGFYIRNQTKKSVALYRAAERLGKARGCKTFQGETNDVKIVKGEMHCFTIYYTLLYKV
jgi:hypothetical protein